MDSAYASGARGSEILYTRRFADRARLKPESTYCPSEGAFSFA